MTPALPGDAAPDAVAAALAALGPVGRAGVPLGPLTTYRVGGAAAVLATVTGPADLAAVAAAVAASGLPVLVVGRGSNLLVADRGFAGLAVVLEAGSFGGFEVDRTGATPLVTAGAALPLPALARRSVDAGLTGLEWAVGVPGSVGGGVRMNAGGHGSDVATSLRSCRVADLAAGGAVVDLTPGDVDLGYRRSRVRPDQVVVDAVLAADTGNTERGRETIRDIVRWRREHQPGGQNAGSVFTNPVFANPVPTTPSATPGPTLSDGGPPSAGRLVDAAGLRGLRRGSAEVSPKHANFIQADAGGSADDVHALIGEVRRRVADRFGVELRTEIRLIGFGQPSTSGGGSG